MTNDQRKAHVQNASLAIVSYARENRITLQDNFLAAYQKALAPDNKPTLWALRSVGFSVGVWGDEATVGFKVKDGRVQTEISWSSTGRSIPIALAAVANYQRAVAFAAFVEALNV